MLSSNLSACLQSDAPHREQHSAAPRHAINAVEKLFEYFVTHTGDQTKASHINTVGESQVKTSLDGMPFDVGIRRAILALIVSRRPAPREDLDALHSVAPSDSVAHVVKIRPTRQATIREPIPAKAGTVALKLGSLQHHERILLERAARIRVRQQEVDERTKGINETLGSSTKSRRHGDTEDLRAELVGLVTESFNLMRDRRRTEKQPAYRHAAIRMYWMCFHAGILE